MKFDASFIQFVMEPNRIRDQSSSVCTLRTCGEEYDGYGLVAATPAAEAE